MDLSATDIKNSMYTNAHTDVSLCARADNDVTIQDAF